MFFTLLFPSGGEKGGGAEERNAAAGKGGGGYYDSVTLTRMLTAQANMKTTSLTGSRRRQVNLAFGFYDLTWGTSKC